MIKVFSDKVFRFSNGERDAQGHLKSWTTKIGFCELPEWVTETLMWKLATKEKSLRLVSFGDNDESSVKMHEELESLRAENLALKQKQMMDDVAKTVAPEEEVIPKRRGRTKAV